MSTIFKCNSSYETIPSDELIVIEQRMYPGKYSELGFLQEGETLQKVYDDDKRFLEACNITYDQIADRLDTILGKYYRALNNESRVKKGSVYDRNPKLEYVVEDTYRITSVSYMGAQGCPFQNKEKDPDYHGYEYGSTDVTIKNMVNSSTITFNTLLPHMIRCHHFFESPKSSHRLDPLQVIRTLEIQQNVDYKPQYKHYYSWSASSSCSHTQLTQSDIDLIKSISLASYYIDNNTSALLFPSYNCLGVASCVDKKNIKYIRDNGPNIDWYNYRITYLLNKREQDLQHDYLKDYTPSVEEIEKSINEEIKKIHDYKSTGNIEGMALFLFRLGNHKYDTYHTIVAGAELSYSTNAEAIYICRKYKYIPVNEND